MVIKEVVEIVYNIYSSLVIWFGKGIIFVILIVKISN